VHGVSSPTTVKLTAKFSGAAERPDRLHINDDGAAQAFAQRARHQAARRRRKVPERRLGEGRQKRFDDTVQISLDVMARASKS